MDRPGGLFSSAIGRRLLVLFFIAAFVPVALMMLIAVNKVDTALETTLDDDLAQSAKAYGMQVIERLLREEQRLRVVDEPGGWARLRDEVENQRGGIVGLARLAADGSVESAVGDVPRNIGLDAQALGRIADNTTVLVIPPDAGGQVLLVRRQTRGNGQVDVTVAAPQMQRIWGNPETFPSQTDFCVTTARSIHLHCSHPFGLPNYDWAALARGGARSLRWEENGEPMRAAAWALFVGSRFVGEDWVILSIQPERFALEPARSFHAAFLPVGVLALLIVVFIATNQLRRILTPLQQLLDSARRMGRRDFQSRVAVRGNDEFSQLAGAFNTMADRIGVQFNMFAAFADIDRTLLTTLDLTDVAAIAARCVAAITGAEVVSIALIEPGTTDRLRVYGAAGMDPSRWAGMEFQCVRHPADAIRAHAWSTEPPLPPGYLALLRGTGSAHFALVPVVRGTAAAGLIVLGRKTPRAIVEEQAAQLAGVADRIAIALAAVERDRKLYDQAHFDALTGLPNRYHLLSLLGQSLARAQRSGTQVAVLFVDLDNFKRTNDTLGHAAGDSLLQAAATRLREALREGDLVARLGGDEFTIVLDQVADARAAGASARKVIEVLSQPYPMQDQESYVGASVGIALYPADGTTADVLLKKADTAMYRAKALGRGSVAFYEERMNAEARERVRLDRELRLAIQRREFVLHYQPQVEARTRRVTGVEALVRWQHPERGLLAPAAFIDVAEESGLVDPIGAWVLDQACAQLAQWRRGGLALGHVAVNVSIRQLLRPDFAGRVQAALAHHRLEPSALAIEVTESLFADLNAVEELRRLQRLGLKIAVDDFGTGYSSFAYLRDLPISTLKIDRAFIVDVPGNGPAATIVAAIIDMAHALGKDIVAEGVETDEQAAFLARSGCEQLQGYAISRPLEADKVERFMRAPAPAERTDAAAAAASHTGALQVEA